MKTIIAGSRTITEYQYILDAIHESEFEITEIVSGTAKGVDILGERYAKESNILLTKYPADWNKYGKSAGYIRNAEMAKYADQLIAIWDGDSRGTKNMIDIAEKHNLKIYVKNINNIWDTICNNTQT